LPGGEEPGESVRRFWWFFCAWRRRHRPWAGARSDRKMSQCCACSNSALKKQPVHTRIWARVNEIARVPRRARELDAPGNWTRRIHSRGDGFPIALRQAAHAHARAAIIGAEGRVDGAGLALALRGHAVACGNQLADKGR